jgi:hypothetical protein
MNTLDSDIPYLSHPDDIFWFFNLPNPSSRTMVLVLTQPLTTVSVMNPKWDKGTSEHKADNLTAVYELIF